MDLDGAEEYAAGAAVLRTEAMPDVAVHPRRGVVAALLLGIPACLFKTGQLDGLTSRLPVPLGGTAEPGPVVGRWRSPRIEWSSDLACSPTSWWPRRATDTLDSAAGAD